MKKQSLNITHPKLTKQWHPHFNNISPSNISYGSHQKVWWLGDCGHEWDMSVKDRSQGNNCPFCAGKRVDFSNSLTAKRPELIKEWHIEKNKISPDSVTLYSNKKVWWVCSFGHEWRSSINNRTSAGKGCPYCANQKVCKSNCLETRFPELSKEWHPTLNTLSACDVLPHSNKKFWWTSNCGHVWHASVSRRVYGTNCPYCSGKRICDSNCLAKISPNLISEWHPTKNDLNAYEVTNFSSKKVWWICSFGHEWQAIISNRTGKMKSGCPYCKFESKGEKLISSTLILTNINFERQFKIRECRHKKVLPFDFALKNNTNKLLGLIEYQGEQHYKLMRFTNAKLILENTKMRDKIKFDFCLKNNIKLLIIPYWTKDISEVVKKFVREATL